MTTIIQMAFFFADDNSREKKDFTQSNHTE